MANQMAELSKHYPASTASVSAQKEQQATAAKIRHAADQNLMTKISKEADKIIKMKVVQNSVNWELREQVKELESIRDRQQQNLVQLQMQYETLDGDYQNELRKREDTLNRVFNTRSICDSLETHIVRLTEILTRCKADQNTMVESYQKAASVIMEVRLKINKNEEQYKTTLDNLKQQLASERQHKLEMSENWGHNKSVLEKLNSELKKSCDNMEANRNILQQENREKSVEINDKDNIIETLHSELSSMQKKYNDEIAQNKLITFQQGKEISDKSEQMATLKATLGNQEQFLQKLAEENSQLREEIAQLEENCSHMEEMKITNVSLTSELSCMQIEANRLANHNNELSAMCNEQVQQNCHLKEEQQKMLEANSVQANNIMDIEKSREQVIEQKNQLIAEHEATVTEINQVLEKKSTELQAKSNLLATLMTDIKNGLDQRAKLEITVDKYKKDLQKAKGTEKDLMEDKITFEKELHTKQSQIEKQKEMLEVAGAETVMLKTQIKSMQEKILAKTKECEEAKKSAASLKCPSPCKTKDLSGNRSSDSDSPLMLSPVFKSQEKPTAPNQESSWVRPSRPKVPRVPKVTFAIPESRKAPVPSPRPAKDEFDFFSDSSLEGYVINAMLAGKKVASPMRVVKKHKYHTHAAAAKEQIPEKGPRNKNSTTGKRRSSMQMSDHVAKQLKGN